MDELQGLKVDQKGFILAHDAFSQLIEKSQELFQVIKVKSR